MAKAVHIGTSGWHYRHWLGPFYPPKWPPSKMLSMYVRHFRTVELNTTFYRLPPESAVREWHDSTPPNFCFAAKGSRFLTHMKKLQDPGQALERYFERADLLREKLGPVLWQLPPNWTVDVDRFAAFLEALPTHRRYAFEFRNQTWDIEPIRALLRKHNAGYCIYDLAGYQSPLDVTADFTYVRLHGPGGKYQGSYSDGALRVWRDNIRKWQQSLNEVYVYFDNDDSGYAVQNALTLKRMVEEG